MANEYDNILELIPQLEKVLYPQGDVISPEAEKIRRENELSQGRMSQAYQESQKDPTNFVDKWSPLLAAIAFVADKTSGNVRRRNLAGEKYTQYSQGRQANIQSKKDKLRQTFLDKMAMEEMLGKKRSEVFENLYKGESVKTSRKGQTASLAANLQEEKRLTKQQGELTAQQKIALKEKEQEVQEKNKARELMTKYINGEVTDEDILSDAYSQELMFKHYGWQPPDYEKIISDVDTDINKKLDSKYGNALTELTTVAVQENSPEAWAAVDQLEKRIEAEKDLLRANHPKLARFRKPNKDEGTEDSTIAKKIKEAVDKLKEVGQGDIMKQFIQFQGGQNPFVGSTLK